MTGSSASVPGAIRIRRVDVADIPAWVGLRRKLWPEESPESLADQAREALSARPSWIIFAAEAGRALVGFIELNLRSYAEGCDTSPVPYVEGWYVEEAWRKQGIGRTLMQEAEAWSRAQGFKEMGSDALAGNRLSRRAHAALGFREVVTLVVFRKPLI